MKIGTPKHEKATKNYFSFKKDQNTFILRVLPPLGRLADLGKWSMFHRVEFGYTGTDGKMKPFLSPRVVNYQGMVEVESEAHKRRQLLEAQQKQAKDAGNKAVEEQIRILLEKYNQDAKHYMNVIDLQGNIGLFKIGHRGFEALKAEVKRLQSEGVEPMGVENGRFFVFSRSGRGRDTIYTAQEYKQKTEVVGPNGQKIIADLPFPHSLNETIIAKLATDAFELDTVYPSVTSEQEYRIVHEGAKAIDEILGGGGKTQGNPASTAQAAAATTTTAQAAAPTNNEAALAELNKLMAQQATQTVATQTVATQTVATPTVEAAATPTVEAAAVVQAAAAPITSVPNLAAMSEEDFFKMVEKGGF
jgi:hypothetical protein